jgi:arginase
MALTARSPKSRIALIGAPSDLGGANRGSAMGPGALRAAGFADALRRHHDVIDRGDAVGVGNAPGRTIDTCHHLDEVTASCRSVRDLVGAALRDGDVPLLMGGDHSLAIGSMAAVARHCDRIGKKLFVLWLDAHADFNTPASSPTGFLYGMPVAVATGDGHPQLLELGHARPMLDIARVTQIGVRSIDPLEEKRIRERGLRVHGMKEIRSRGMQPIVTDALDEVRRQGGHLHVSMDVDFLDPSIAPGVGLAEPDGPNMREAEACMTAIAQSGLLGSFDLVELNPVVDPSGGTTRRVMQLVERAFSGRLREAHEAALTAVSVPPA